MLLSLAEWLQTLMPQWGFLRVPTMSTHSWTPNPSPLGLSARLPIHYLSRCDGRIDGASDWIDCGTDCDPPSDSSQNWSASSRLRDAKPLGEIGDAHHGRCIGFDRYL